MTKTKLLEILKSLKIPVNEGIQNDVSTNTYPRIVFWEFVWDPVNASGDGYDTIVTYQISFFSKIPRDPKLMELKQELKKSGINPRIEHEYIEKDKYFHSFFSVDVMENV